MFNSKLEILFVVITQINEHITEYKVNSRNRSRMQRSSEIENSLKCHRNDESTQRRTELCWNKINVENNEDAMNFGFEQQIWLFFKIQTRLTIRIPSYRVPLYLSAGFSNG